MGTDASKVKIVAKSKMTTTNGRVGALSMKSAKKTASTGGDLSCVKKAQTFQAKGSYKVTWPAGYKPTTGSYSKFSKKLKFKLAASGSKKGKCVAG
ncbi:hypothetical protein [Leucobacter sp. USHLN153]|uniref:hypothetical protein n=1 Tax=Leucobacter sp. USHLN153 TaxID=3081268 RepID=UPI003015AAF4